MKWNLQGIGWEEKCKEANVEGGKSTELGRKKERRKAKNEDK